MGKQNRWNILLWLNWCKPRDYFLSAGLWFSRIHSRVPGVGYYAVISGNTTYTNSYTFRGQMSSSSLDCLICAEEIKENGRYFRFKQRAANLEGKKKEIQLWINICVGQGLTSSPATAAVCNNEWGTGTQELFMKGSVSGERYFLITSCFDH